MKRGEFTGDARLTVSRRISVSRLAPRTSDGAAEALIRGPAQDSRAAGQSLRAPGFGSAFGGLWRWAPARIPLCCMRPGRGAVPRTSDGESRSADPGSSAGDPRRGQSAESAGVGRLRRPFALGPGSHSASLHASGARGRSPDKRRSRSADPGGTGPVPHSAAPANENGAPAVRPGRRVQGSKPAPGRQRRRPQTEIRLPRLPRRRVRRPRRRARWRARPRSRRPRHGRCARPRRGPGARPLPRCGRR